MSPIKLFAILIAGIVITLVIGTAIGYAWYWRFVPPVQAESPTATYTLPPDIDYGVPAYPEPTYEPPPVATPTSTQPAEEGARTDLYYCQNGVCGWIEGIDEVSVKIRRQEEYCVAFCP